MSTSGAGVFFDGQTNQRRHVHFELGEQLLILQPDGRRIAAWPYSDLREVTGPAGPMRLACEGAAPLARLEIRDEALAQGVRDRAPKLAAGRARENSLQRKVVFWSLAAVVSASVLGIYGIPALADRLAPILPWSVDQRIGAAMDRQIRYIFPVEGDRFECGEGPQEAEGRAALDEMAKTLSDAAGLPIPIRVVAVRSAIPNALALPGGPVYMFDGLIREAKGPDELAGVLAHEIGHVARRDGARKALQAGGASFLFGFVLGDFAGGTVAILVARAISEASYSRAAENDADMYAVRLMRAVGADPRALGAILARLDASDEGRSPLAYLSSHPATAERKRAIDAAADGASPARPILDERSFAALKRICGEKRP